MTEFKIMKFMYFKEICCQGPDAQKAYGIDGSEGEQNAHEKCRTHKEFIE